MLFCDLVASTELVERLDPEIVRSLQIRYASLARDAVVSHGGVIEKFIGDAIVAVFGIPERHEDDAMRACRSALELVPAISSLGGELGVPLEVRIGIATGEVVAAADAASGELLVTGAAMNTAARLQNAAERRQVWLDTSTAERVHSLGEIERLGPLTLKGIAREVEAFRLVGLGAGSARQVETPLVGRAAELGVLLGSFHQVIESRSPRLALVLGAAGVGKSRLVHELMVDARRAGARVFRGRCLAYGAGITYWPIAEVIRAAAGVVPDDSVGLARDKVGALVADLADGEVLARRLESLLGLNGEPAPADELAWAVRSTIEHLAAREPLAIVIDDVQWAESRLLDLLIDLVERGTDAPLAVIAVARPELAETHPDWLIRPSVVVTLDPLAGDASAALLEGLYPGRTWDPAVRARIAQLADGNPLFLEQYAAMLQEKGDIAEVDGGIVATGDLDALPTPATIADLLAARLDLLPDREHRVAERASVVGRTFWQDAVARLSPVAERPNVPPALDALVRRDVLLPDHSEFDDDRAFRFRHLLLRDTAYASLTKAQRADLHKRFANWLRRRMGERAGEYAEVLGYHFEQAYQFGVEIGSLDAPARAAAHEYLSTAGMRSYERGDLRAASQLLARASHASDRDERRLALELRSGRADWGAATTSAERDTAVVRVEAVKQEATALGLDVLASIADVWLATWRWRQGSLSLAGAESVASEAIRLMRNANELEGLSDALSLRAEVEEKRGEGEAVRMTALAAYDAAKASGFAWARARSAAFVSFFPLESSVPIPEALVELDELQDGQPDTVIPGLAIECRRAVLLAADRRPSEARQALDRARSLLERSDIDDYRVFVNAHDFEIQEILGDYEAALVAATGVMAIVRDSGDRSDLATAAGDVAHALLHLRRAPEAAELLVWAGPLVPPDATGDRLAFRATELWSEAQLGHEPAALAEARTLAVDARAIDRWLMNQRVLESYLEISRLAGSPDDVVAAGAGLRQIYERKGHRAGLARLEALGLGHDPRPQLVDRV